MSHLSFRRMMKVDFVQSFLLVVISWSLLLCASQQAAAQMKFVQVNSAVPTSTATISATYNSAQTAGNMNVVAIGWDSSFITRSEEHTSELQSLRHLVCRLLLEKKK